MITTIISSNSKNLIQFHGSQQLEIKSNELCCCCCCCCRLFGRYSFLEIRHTRAKHVDVCTVQESLVIEATSSWKSELLFLEVIITCQPESEIESGMQLHNNNLETQKSGWQLTYCIVAVYICYEILFNYLLYHVINY